VQSDIRASCQDNVSICCLAANEGLPSAQAVAERIGDTSQELSPTEIGPITEDDVHMHICQEMASGKNAPYPNTGSSYSHEIIEYQNEMSPTSILGDFLGQSKARRLIKVVIANPDQDRNGHTPGDCIRSVRRLEISGLDNAEAAFLSTKGVFDLPPGPIWYRIILAFP
jgi:hypothetical protein